MKGKVLLPLALFCFTAFPLKGQIIEFSSLSNGTNVITIPTGERWKLITFLGAHYIPVNSNTNQTSGSLVGYIAGGVEEFIGEGRGYGSVGAILVGPKFIYPGSSRYTLVFQKIPENSSGMTSSTAVVIPSSATGDVDVKMEQRLS